MKPEPTAMEQRSVTELRNMAQALGASWTWGDKKPHLIEKIEAAARAKLPKPPPPEPPQDLRLRSTPPSEGSTQLQLREVLAFYIERGLKLTFTDAEHWHIAYGGKEDSGSLRMPLRVVAGCAQRVMQ